MTAPIPTRSPMITYTDSRMFLTLIPARKAA